jgi:hypothetical protein
MAITLDGSNGLVVSGNTNTLSGLTVGKGNGAVSTNTAIGASALAANTTGAENTAVGQGAAGATTTGNYNTAMGRNTFALNTTGSSNAAFGQAALYTNSTGSSNTGIGFQALALNTTASNGTAVGYQAGYSNTTGDGGTFVGRLAGYANTTGGGNVAMGNSAFNANTTGTSNTAIGQQALGQNTTASNNTAVGYQAGYAVTTGIRNTYIGTQSGYTNTVGLDNVCVGYTAGYFSTGSYNTFVGPQGTTGNAAGALMTTGSKNTILGSFSGNQGSLDIRTSNNMIVLSDGDGNPRMYCDGNGAFRIPTGRITVNSNLFTSGAQGYIEVEGDTASVRNLFASNNTAAGTGSVGFFAFKRNGTYTGGISQTDAATSFLTSSDYRLKENVVPMTGALARISQLKPCTYTWKASGKTSQGFIAHELAEVCPEAVSGEKDAVYEDGSIKSQGIDTSFLVATLTAAIKEQQAIITTLTERITALEGA